MTSVEITVNRSYKDFISEKEFTQTIKEMKKLKQKGFMFYSQKFL